MVRKANRFPESNGAGIVTKNIHCHPLISWPHLGEQDVHPLATNAGTALHEELPQVNTIFVFLVKGISQDS